MKKLLFLLIAVSLVGSIFAAGNAKEGILGSIRMSSAVKVETQIRILTIMNHLQITTSQASALAKSMTELKNNVNSLQEERLKALTSLRDALLSSNKEAIANAQEKLKDISQSYLETLKNFEDSVESVITLKQALSIDRWVKSAIEESGPLQDFLRNFIGKPVNIFGRKNIPQILAQRKTKTDNKSEKKVFSKPQRGTSLIREAYKREDVLYFLVNSNLYDVLVKTLQMKAAITK
ncbi:hypothetical protein [Mesoaciditoga sp.]